MSTTRFAKIGPPGAVVGYWFEDKKITDDPKKMVELIATTGQDPINFALLLNKQYVVRPENMNGVDGYIVFVKK
jgi:uncharacterized lipoprotein YbaY